MKYKVMGNVFQNGERHTICYGEFAYYAEAYDYKEWLDDPDNWKGKLEDKPYMVYVEEIETEVDKYLDEMGAIGDLELDIFDNAMENNEQNDY